MPRRFFVGVDVGTASVRANVVSETGAELGRHSEQISVYRYREDWYEQSSEDIWRAVCAATTGAIRTAVEAKNAASNGFDVSLICGLGFAATCSLVVLDKQMQPLCVSPETRESKADTEGPPTGGDGDSSPFIRNIVMWCDHRAVEETKEANATGHEVLSYVGGGLSIEMQIPKIMWLSRKLPKGRWEQAAKLFDLADYLVWRAAGGSSGKGTVRDERSICTISCKWTYRQCQGWSEDFLKAVALGSLLERGMLGTHVLPVGAAANVGERSSGRGGVNFDVLSELGLLSSSDCDKGEAGARVVLASGLIDAHAGAMALLGCELKSTWLPASIPLTKRLALICGTSACHMALTKDPVFVKGVWGPYQSALVPGLWLLEGGQSATGSLIDHVVETHPCYQLALQHAVEQGLHVHGYLNTVLQAEASKRGLACVALLTKQLHVQPDFHGNRSPRADATLRGAVQGLRLGDNSVEALAVLYLACVQALAYGTRHIIEEMAAKGVHFDCVMACGGLTKNPLFLQQHANITKLPFVLAESQETVSLGAAIAARAAADSVSSSDRAQDRAEAEAAAEDQAVTNCDTSVKQGGGESGALLVSAMRRMGRAGRVVMPYFEDSRDVSVDGSVAEEETSFHSKKYRVFHAMHEHHMECRRIMQGT